MKMTRHVLRLFIIYSIIVFVGLFIYTNYKCDIPENFIFSKNLYKFIDSVIAFISFLPAMVLSSILLGYSWAFGRNIDEAINRFSIQIMHFFKNVLIVGIVFTSLIVVSDEILLPSLKVKQKVMLTQSDDFYRFKDLAQKSLQENDIIHARFYIDRALGIDLENEEAKQISSDIEQFENLEKFNSKKSEIKEDTNVYVSSSGQSYTVSSLMELARQSWLKENYFDAHYYSSLVLDIAPDDDGNITNAKQLRSDSWNMLNEVTRYIDEESEEVYQSKKDGYMALIEEDYSSAYYTFLDLMNKYPKDPDVVRYFDIANEKLNTQYFFIDETYNLNLFEEYNNVYFSYETSGGGLDVVSIKGITSVKETGSFIQYLRDLNIVSYNANGNFVKSVSVPYAKMFSQALEKMPNEVKGTMEKYGKIKDVPVIMLESLDRNTEGVFYLPYYEFALGVEQDEPLLYTFVMPYSDFNLLCEASQGISNMPLDILLNFTKKASFYGYSREVFSQNLILRITNPIVIMILIILITVLSWNYRLSKASVFKFIWLFLFPIFSIVIYVILQIVQFALSVLYFALVGITGDLSLIIVPVFLLFILILSCIRFTSLKSE